MRCQRGSLPDRSCLKRAAADPQSPKQGRPAAVIVGHEEYESLIETLNILADSDTGPLSPKPRLTSLPETSFPSGCMTSCGWHAWPARSSRANLSRPVGLAAKTNKGAAPGDP